MQVFAESELILNPNGSVYHLNLLPEQVATTIITVGDPDRVPAVSKHFDYLDHSVHKREFLTHTGRIGNQRLTVISTGIGTSNIDIVLNELDALFNIDLESRQLKAKLTPLQFIRIGTSGCLKKEIPIDTFLVSQFAIGMDNLLNYYQMEHSEAEKDLTTKVHHFLTQETPSIGILPTAFETKHSLLNTLGDNFIKGITLTCPGFYGPQGRQLRAKNKAAQFLDVFDQFNQQKFRFANQHNWQITNFEMETAAIYGMTKMLGHQAISFNALLANRATGEFSNNSRETVNKLIETVLDLIMT